MSKRTIHMYPSVIAARGAGRKRIRKQIADAARELADESPAALGKPMQTLLSTSVLASRAAGLMSREEAWGALGAPAGHCSRVDAMRAKEVEIATRPLAGAMALPAQLVASQWHEANYRFSVSAVAADAQKISPAAAGDQPPLEQRMTTMRAKLQVQGVSDINTCGPNWTPDNQDLVKSGERLNFMAVGLGRAYNEDGSGDEDNTYSRWSPQANFDLVCMNPALFGQFKVGDKFYVDFTRADVAAGVQEGADATQG
ncbi:hypothetical protein LMG28688_01596 [Paraburkholderia caffeinitolerans]|uniref:Uncharacterized protein n=1 Tax=Paraburkholderia caffeinitolerans TaxID=1723730 RepID=A0A6J5FM54_9BURK|nr:hypothetical protein [Paraburkholderia caffeinitolerans]CAB3783183.1 hypothetical protein LMG28688_01596 [Paraburkholderia caffeinitolerans]